MAARTLAFLAILAALWACAPALDGGEADGDGDADGDADAEGDADPDADLTPTDGSPDSPTCETSSHGAEPRPSTVMLQLDTSGSMNCLAEARSCADGEPTPDPNDSRWDVLRARLEEALALLPGATSVGLMRYPEPGSSCAGASPVYPLTPLVDGGAGLGEALVGVVPDGITPTHDAVLHALAALGRSGGERPFLLLATDGAATVCEGCDAGCSWDALDADHEEMVRDIAEAAAGGTPTFVIGVPGSQSFRSILSRMASAGGTARSATCSETGDEPCHFDLTDPGLDFATALTEALAAITEAVLSCEYDIPPNPDGHFDPGQVNVRFTDGSGAEVVVPRDRTRADGWDYSDDGGRIVLHGPACDRVREAAEGRVDIAFGCPTILI